MPRVTKNAPRPFKREGMHRLNCSALECPGYMYGTVANLETMLATFGRLPACACGESFECERLELAAALGLEHPAEEALRRVQDHKERAQLRRIGRNGELERRMAGTLNNMAAVALDELRRDERAAARARRLAALNRGTSTATARETAAADIPF
jgi:hypothetical protein